MIHLSNVLAFKPLGRLQVASRRVLAEARIGTTVGGPPPFWYFQYVRTDGLLSVRSPSGYEDAVSPLDVCDVRQGEPVVVQAMPRSVFLERLRLPLAQRQNAPDPACYAPAHVMWAHRSRHGHVDAVVRFVDDALNEGDRWKTWLAPLTDSEHNRLRKVARRSRMPVMARTASGSWSADVGLKAEDRRAQQAARTFIHAALHQ